MSHEVFYETDQTTPPLFNERAVLEGLDEATLNDLKEETLAKMSRLESLIWLINDVKEGAGYDVS